MNRSHVTLMAATVALLQGCATPPAAAPVDTTGQMLDAKLTQSAQKIERMLVDVSRASAISSVAPKGGKVIVDGETATVVWNGDAAPLLKKIADAKGLKFTPLGRAVQIPVAIEASEAPILEVLENIGVQMGSRADVILTSDAVEIQYRAY